MSAGASGDAAEIAPESGPQGREEAGAWVPEFEGQRPPFEPGNEAAVTHGARSAKKVAQMAARVSDELLTRFPVVAEYPETLTALARVETVTRLLFADIVANGVRGKESVVARYFTAENSAAKLRASLGMTPVSEAQVARDRAAAAASTVDVVGELIKQGRATRAGALEAVEREARAFAPAPSTHHQEES